MKLGKTRSPWVAACGPAAAFILTCRRLKWEAVSAIKLIIDQGDTLNLILDPPAAILRQVQQVVQRRRWRRVERSFPRLGVNGSGRGPLTAPLWKLLRAKTSAKTWTEQEKGSFKSALAGRQFSQYKVKACGWSTHHRCLVCLNDIVEADKPYRGETRRSVREAVVATSEQIARAPVGNLHHRCWSGKCLKDLRKGKAPPEDVRTASSVEVAGNPAWERALAPRPPLPKRGRAKHETFHWKVKPRSLPVTGRVYPDGSMLDGIAPELAREGWGVAVLDDDGNVLAAAYGIPPPWLRGIESVGVVPRFAHDHPPAGHVLARLPPCGAAHLAGTCGGAEP